MRPGVSHNTSNLRRLRTSRESLPGSLCVGDAMPEGVTGRGEGRLEGEQEVSVVSVASGEMSGDFAFNCV